MLSQPFVLRCLTASVLVLPLLSWAGRPQVVDDAGVNDTGHGHVEVWWTHGPSGVRGFTAAPAYAPLDGVELSVAHNRDLAGRDHSWLAQAKIQITPSQEEGCNFAVALGQLHVYQQGSTSLVNGLMSCNRGPWSLHANLGGLRAPASPLARTWGLGLEHRWDSWTLILEAFGQRHTQPTLQLGARTWLTPAWQLDASVGAQGGRGVATLGVKYQF